MKKREDMILNNLGLVGSIVNKRFSSYNYEYEDLFMTGVEGLIIAVDTFDSNRDTSFAGYAYACIYNEIANMIKVDYRHNKPDLNISYNTEDTKHLVDHNSVYNIETDFFRKEDIIVIRELMNKVCLCDRDINIAKKYFGFEGIKYTQRKLADMYNMSHSNIQLIIKRFLKSMTILLIDEYGNDYIKKNRKDILFKTKY